MNEKGFDVQALLREELFRVKDVGHRALASFSGGAIDMLWSPNFRRCIPAFVILLLGLSACDAVPTQEIPTPGDSKDPRPTQPSIEVGPTAESISSEDPFESYGGGGEISEEQIRFLESQRGLDLIKAWGVFGDRLKETGVHGEGTFLTLMPIPDQADPNNPEKMFIVASVDAPGEDNDNTVITFPIQATNAYLLGIPNEDDPSKSVAPGDINQLMLPPDRMYEPLELTRVVKEGTVPADKGIPLGAILMLEKGEWVYKYGSGPSVAGLKTVGYIGEDFQWTVVETTAGETETGTEFTNPFGVEEAELIESAGYLFDGKTGTLTKDRVVVARYDGSSWVDENGVEIDNLVFNPNGGVDYEGKPVVGMFTGTVESEDGEGEFKTFGPLSKEWFVPADVPASQELMEREWRTGELSETNWGDYKDIIFSEIPEVTEEFANSEQLLESAWLYLKPIPNNVRMPTLQCIKRDVIGNVWDITQFPRGTANGHYLGYLDLVKDVNDRPIVVRNNGVNQNLFAFKHQDAETGNWVIDQGTQYYQEDPSGNVVSTILVVRHTGRSADPGDSWFSSTQKMLIYPGQLVAQPQCSDPSVRGLLQIDLRNQINKLDKDPNVKSVDAGYYSMPIEVMARLQEARFTHYSVEDSQPWNLLSEEGNPKFDPYFPNR